MTDSLYIIGIDLGTTNSTMAYTPFQRAEGESPKLTQFPIVQNLDGQTVGPSLSLPSFLYLPLDEELQALVSSLPLSKEAPYIVGAYARDRGAELPLRLVASAKSWLSHPDIDKREKLLPLDFDETEKKISPLDACAAILGHLKKAWNDAKPEAPFQNQTILITVPASFDPGARQLVLEAAEKAGYPEIVLLEEPQAAFYAWLHSYAESWRKQLKVGDSVLVVDIGGGTTDFSLIQVEEEEGNLQLKRQAVGSHLLLGGDNIDTGLAYLAQQKFEEKGHLLDHWQVQALIHQCRQAKETLLGENPPNSVPVTVLGRGSRLIGNTLTAELTLEEVQRFVIDGFIPLVEPDEQSPVEQQAGLKALGLPYVKDPRISCQLAKFLSMTGESESGKMERFIVPSAVLFNGGTMKSAAIRSRIIQLLNQWAKALDKPSVKELEGADFDYSVSRGAAYYGIARQGQAIRIRSGTNRSYYIGIEEAAPAVPGLVPQLRAICVVPFGMEEGEECDLENQEFALVLGEQAAFRFFSHATRTLSNGEEPRIGTLVRSWKNELTELHPIEALLTRKEGDGKTVRVKLKSKVTELGVLELWCVAADGRKWKLEFDIR